MHFRQKFFKKFPPQKGFFVGGIFLANVVYCIQKSPALAAKPLVDSGNNPLYMSLDEIEAWEDGLETFRATLVPKYGDKVEVTLEGVRHGSSVNDTRETLSLTEEYTTDDAAIQKLVKGIMTRPRLIGVYRPVFGNKTYMGVALLHSVK